ncbi:FAD-dependent oxidoreductase [Sporolactobacillus sp. Y61]|uniref:FAD-dependent oxidoreductase n=1 Tax=Sporolactobacillus sp. Y61 TaxID=3160863 RepID=A0AAU8IFL6_9BACL
MDQKKRVGSFPQKTSSIWRDTVHFPSFKLLNTDIETETLVVGGGITGITAAYVLASRGMKVTLIDAAQLASGTTGYTTAKITAQHGLIYNELLAHIGQEKAQLYYHANSEALEWIRQMVLNHDLRCDFTQHPAFVYATTDKEAKEIEKEKEAYDLLGIPGSLKQKINLSMNIKNALEMPDQAQFHPLMYLHFLIAELVRMGVSIYEQTLAVDLDERPSPVVHTREGFAIHCRDVLICSHFPFYDNRFYFSRMYPERSYLMACETDQPFPDGMYISASDPKRSLRSLSLSGKKGVLVGGENHKTGRGESTDIHYQRLEGFANAVLGENRKMAFWSAQDYTTVDKIPYIGRMAKNRPHVYVAAGFRKWGMTTGTLAANLLADLLLERNNPYTDLFSPARFEADPMIKRFFIENSAVAGNLIKGKIERGGSLDDLGSDQGAVIHFNGKRAGAYKRLDDRLTIVDTTCPHMGCEVNWNQGERTWDCPCHGSRFRATGEVIDGPAQEPLKQLYSEKRKDTEGDTPA